MAITCEPAVAAAPVAVESATPLITVYASPKYNVPESV